MNNSSSCLRPNPPSCGIRPGCPSEDGCIEGVCPDFEIKRNDTLPPFKVCVTNEEGDPLDLTGLVAEASMWANAKLKTAIIPSDTALAFADCIGFSQVLPDDIILADRVRCPEYMRVTGFDEDQKLVYVERGVNGTQAYSWKKGTPLKIFRFMNAPATTEMVFDDIQQVDGTFLCDQLIESFLIYEWTANDTCVPGCFSLEFKLLKITDGPVSVPSILPRCFSGLGVEWVRRFPTCGEYVIRICKSPTFEVPAC